MRTTPASPASAALMRTTWECELAEPIPERAFSLRLPVRHAVAAALTGTSCLACHYKMGPSLSSGKHVHPSWLPPCLADVDFRVLMPIGSLQ